MGFAEQTGYTPVSIETLMSQVRVNINSQFETNYTEEQFEGTNFYKYFYALMQRVQESEIKTSEIFLKLQQYFSITNAMISRPVVTSPGIVEKFAAEGYVASLKEMIEDDAGKANVCVDVDDSDPDYTEIKLEICQLLSQMIVGGVVTIGTEDEDIVISNGQSFNYKYHLPDRTPIYLRLTLVTSENNQFVIPSPDDTKVKLLANIAARYALGKNFEPQKYFGSVDAPWAESILLEWSENNTDWFSTVFNADFDDLFEVDLARTSIVES